MTWIRPAAGKPGQHRSGGGEEVGDTMKLTTGIVAVAILAGDWPGRRIPASSRTRKNTLNAGEQTADCGVERRRSAKPPATAASRFAAAAAESRDRAPPAKSRCEACRQDRLRRPRKAAPAKRRCPDRQPRNQRPLPQPARLPTDKDQAESASSNDSQSDAEDKKYSMTGKRDPLSVRW